jgi:exonuclease SbcC
VIPVRLRLKNFLSYGTAAEELDFETFNVACLSGGNGQGKSALLDAITWAIWGEARKSAGAVKPDEELLRVGTREMEVELVFDLEGTRYRVVRAFTRTASGKTSKPGLEFAVLDPEAADWRPLTADHVRTTQAEIEKRVGLDYDTFINSAFLLQGRSDEFTKRKPAERKEVLARILGLDRYERLAARASERYSEARERVRRGEEAVERLQGALEEEPRWKEEFAATQAAAAALAAERDRVATDEAALAQRLAALDAEARRADAHRDALARLDERRARLAGEEEGLRVQIAEAEATTARAAEIEAAYTRFESLQKDRAELDEKANLHRGLSNQAHDLKLKLKETRADLDGRLGRLDADLRADRERLADDERRLVERPQAEAGYQQARAAAERARALHGVRQQREHLAARLDALDKRLLGVRNELQGRIGSNEARLQAAAEAPATLDRLRARAGALAREVAEVEGWQQGRDRVRGEGAERKAQRDAARADVERLREEAAALDARRALIRTTDEEACPTCGTHLTEAHRRTVEATYTRELEALAERIAAREAEAAALHRACAALAEEFKAFDAQIAGRNGVAAEHARVLQQIAGLEEERTTLDALRRETAELRRRVETLDFEPALHAERTRLDEELAALPFDEAAYEAARADAAHLDRWTRTLDELEGITERHARLAAKIAKGEAEAARLRADLAEGTTLAPLMARIEAIERQAAALGYDGARHEDVQRTLAALADAPQAVARLAAARLNLADWARRLAALSDEHAACDRESVEHRAALDAAAGVLAERPGLTERLGATRAERVRSERELADAQARLGGLKEKLDRCAADREALRSERAALKEARHEAAVQRHLRQAFGRHGIPSLIIEETLPEVEERANALLERLSGGRTRVALETQKDKKTGGTKETLEIRITDEQGVARPYETFSGGEAFRVNFALRIALAQLLAERAGVRIRTLVVDEGFGTQDQDGLHSLVEAIRTIQDDFDKILVITHLDELKNAFPVRIEVTKRPVEGSSFVVMGV